MIGILVLTTALQNQAFVVQDRQHQAAVLATQVSGLQAAVADKRSVQSLAVAAGCLLFLSLFTLALLKRGYKLRG